MDLMGIMGLMVIYSSEHFLVNLEGIALAQFCDELILLEALVVANHLIANIRPLCGTFLQHLAENTDVRIALDRLEFCTLHLKRQIVYIGIVALLEDTTLHANHDAVLVEGLANGTHPLVLRQFLDELLHSFDIGSVLALVNHTAVVRFIPCILLLILLEVSSQ